MKKLIILATLLMGFIVIDSLGQMETVLEHKVPPGWKYKSFSISSSQVKALFFLPDLSDEALLTSAFPRRLQVFSSENSLIADLTIADNYRLRSITKNDKIILGDGDESGCGHIKLLDLLGNELYTVNAEGRWPVVAPYGKDIALVPGLQDIGPVSIIDEDTGKEKLRINPPESKNKTFKISAFFPLGEEGFYVQGVGATLMLKSYLHVNERYWKIQDIGGNINQGIMLNDEYLAVNYRIDDFSSKKLTVGVAVVEWRTGNVLFNKRGYQINGVQDSWYPNFNTLSLLIDNGSLLFYADPDRVVRLPLRSNGNKGWDENRLVMSELSHSQREEIALGEKHIKPEVRGGKYVITNLGDVVRIEISKYVDVR